MRDLIGIFVLVSVFSGLVSAGVVSHNNIVEGQIKRSEFIQTLSDSESKKLFVLCVQAKYKCDDIIDSYQATR